MFRYAGKDKGWDICTSSSNSCITINTGLLKFRNYIKDLHTCLRGLKGTLQWGWRANRRLNKCSLKKNKSIRLLASPRMGNVTLWPSKANYAEKPGSRPHSCINFKFNQRLKMNNICLNLTRKKVKKKIFFSMKKSMFIWWLGGLASPNSYLFDRKNFFVVSSFEFNFMSMWTCW